MELGRRKLGSNSWAKAFKAAEEWYGPFDAALTENGDDAWTVWKDDIVVRRHELVHGLAVQEATSEETEAVIRFAERLMTWYPQRFLVSTRHPINQRFRQILSKLPRADDVPTNELLEEPHMRALSSEGDDSDVRI